MKLVIIESPYAGNVQENINYLNLCISDCVRRQESPYASHKMLTDSLDDLHPADRVKGIQAGFDWKHVPDVTTIFYTDLGWSKGMKQALDYCEQNNLPFTTRSLLL